jgi:hypothetical protein
MITMRDIQLQFSRPDCSKETFLDRLVTVGINKESHSEICHVDWRRNKNGVFTLIGAHIGGGIQERADDCVAWGVRLRVGLPSTDEQADEFESYCLSMIGTGYDVKDIIGLALSDARIHDPNKEICSEFIGIALHVKAKRLVIDKDLWFLNPEELRLVCASQPDAVRERIEGQ